MEITGIRLPEPLRRMENRTPRSIVGCWFNRVQGGLVISFDNGTSARIESATMPENPSGLDTDTAFAGTAADIILDDRLPGLPQPKPRITIELGTSSHRKPEKVRLTKITLRPDTGLEVDENASKYIRSNPSGFVTTVADLLDAVNPRIVQVDSSWRWGGLSPEKRAEHVRGHISRFTTPMREWLNPVTQTQSQPSAGGTAQS